MVRISARILQGYWPMIFLFCYVFDFGIGVMLALQHEFRSIPSSIFWKALRIGINASLNVWLNSPMKPFVPGLSLVGSFLISASKTLLVICLDVVFLPGPVLEDYILLDMYPFLLCCWHIIVSMFLWCWHIICWHIIVSSIL